MIKSSQKIYKTESIIKSLQKMNKSGSKTLCVVDKKNTLLGTFSDGDLRKIILKGTDLDNIIDGHYNKNPTFFYENIYTNKQLISSFSKDNFDIIPIVNKDKILIKILSWNDFLDKSKSNKLKKINTPVLIMAGGVGERLKPFTNILPKPLIPINGKAVIEIIIDRFLELGFYRFLISKNINDKILNSYFQNHINKKIIKFINEKKKLGTAGALFHIKNKFTENLIVINCDVLLDIDFRDLLNFHKINQNDVTLVVSKIKYKIPYGDVKIVGKSKFKSINEKPEYNILSNTGCYVFSKKIKKVLNKQQQIDMNDFIKILSNKDFKIQIYKIDNDKWHDTGQWNEYENTRKKYNKY